MYAKGYKLNYLSGVRHVEDLASMKSELSEFTLNKLDRLPTAYDRERALEVLSKIQLY